MSLHRAPEWLESRTGHALTEERLRWCAARFREEGSTTAVAKKYGVQRATVSLNVERARKAGVLSDDEQQMIFKEIGERLGMSRANAQKIESQACLKFANRLLADEPFWQWMTEHADDTDMAALRNLRHELSRLVTAPTNGTWQRLEDHDASRL